MPRHSILQITDIVGLIVICFGIFCYKFADDLINKYNIARCYYGAINKKQPATTEIDQTENIIIMLKS